MVEMQIIREPQGISIETDASIGKDDGTAETTRSTYGDPSTTDLGWIRSGSKRTLGVTFLTRSLLVAVASHELCLLPPTTVKRPRVRARLTSRQRPDPKQRHFRRDLPIQLSRDHVLVAATNTWSRDPWPDETDACLHDMPVG